MILRCNVASSCTSASPLRVLRVLLLLSLILTALVPSTRGKTKSIKGELFAELRCRCVKTTSRIHPNHIINLEIIKEGAHCAKVEVIATLKDGRKTCLDPEAPLIKKMVQKILEASQNQKCLRFLTAVPHPPPQISGLDGQWGLNGPGECRKPFACGAPAPASPARLDLAGTSAA
ncbi:platelet basic protein-like [Tamandua tetradactyla]|uniref:platelet basic protein-like n=1 Tax=Tamandua tetradactyla TaxID=48850 RepID=UPI004053A979